MRNEFTNLLPPERQRAVSREYYLRLGVVTAVLITGIVIAAAVLLLPTYVLLMGSSKAKEMRLADIKATTSSSEEAALSARLAAFSSSAAILTKLSDNPSASRIIHSILEVSRPGIKFSHFAYTTASSKSPHTLTLSGTSVTRDALRNYQLALQNSPLVLSANLPISAYAKDSNITFAISITLAP